MEEMQKYKFVCGMVCDPDGDFVAASELRIAQALNAEKDAEIARLRKVADAARAYVTCPKHPWFDGLCAALTELDGGNHG